MLTHAVPLNDESPTSPKTKSSILSHFLQVGVFLKKCYIDGLFAILQGRFNTRQACIIVLATLPLYLTILMLTVPAILFPTEGHHVYYHFARIMSTEPMAIVPFLIGAITTTLGLKVPVN